MRFFAKEDCRARYSERQTRSRQSADFARMTMIPTPATVSKRAQIMTLLAAFLGWLFDGFEMGLFPLIGQPALKDLLGAVASPDDANKWFGAIIAVFLV